MRPTEYATTIKRHIAAFEGGDKRIHDSILANYQGKFWTSDSGESEADLLKTSVNLIFAITETALSTLVPANPQVTLLARNPQDEDRTKAAEGFLNLALDACDYRSEQILYTQDAVLYGRGPTKTVWSPKLDLPIVRSLDHRSLFFDLAARRESDIRYWIEATLVGEDEFKARGYLHAQEINADTYPKWMLTKQNAGATNRDELKNFQKWVTVYEIYDMERGKVSHVAAGHEDTILLEDDILYCPYDLASLNNNGEDCRGLSEIALISPNQEEINHLLTYWLNIVRLSIPKMGYDDGGVDGEKLAKAVAAPLGSWNPMRSTNGKTMAENFMEFPVPKVPPDALALLDKVWNNIEIVSALAAAQRGQVTGARTATELALIEGQLRNRLSSRTKRLDRVTESVSGKMLLLAQKFMREDKMVQLTGREGWHPVAPDTLLGIQGAFKVVPYSPMESNRMVVQEQFLKLMELFGQNPGIDQKKLAKVAIKVFDNPELRNTDIFLPDAPVAPPGGAPGEVPQDVVPPEGMPGADTQIPPEMAQIAANQQILPDVAANMVPPGGLPKVAGLPVPAGVAKG